MALTSRPMPLGEDCRRPRLRCRDRPRRARAASRRAGRPLGQRQPLARLDPQPPLDIGAFPKKLGLDVALEHQLPDDRRDEGLEAGIGCAAAPQRLKRHLDRAGHQRRDIVAVPADRAFGVEQDDIALQAPSRPSALAPARCCRESGRSDCWRARISAPAAEPVDDAVRRPERRARADARGNLLVEHPVGEEFRVVGRDEGRLALRRRQRRVLPARLRENRSCGCRRRRAGRRNLSA